MVRLWNLRLLAELRRVCCNRANIFRVFSIIMQHPRLQATRICFSLMIVSFSRDGFATTFILICREQSWELLCLTQDARKNWIKGSWSEGRDYQCVRYAGPSSLSGPCSLWSLAFSVWWQAWYCFCKMIQHHGVRNKQQKARTCVHSQTKQCGRVSLSFAICISQRMHQSVEKPNLGCELSPLRCMTREIVCHFLPRFVNTGR